MRTRTYLPRPEHPRPDRQRGFVHGVDWVNLNGAWEFRFDGAGAGLDETWFQPDAKRWPDQIIVPFCWESLAAWGEADAAGNDNYFSGRVYRQPLDVTRFNYRQAQRYEIGWYRRTVTIPEGEAWRGKRVILTIGAADFFTDGWCNGQHLGHHEGGYTPFEFDLTNMLETAADGTRSAAIVLRVEDPMENREQPVGKQWGWYSSVSGIWQTVFLEPRATAFIERFEITTDLEAKRAAVKVFTQGGEEVAIEVTGPDRRQFSHVLPVSQNVASGAVPIDPVILWDTNNPALYKVTFTLRSGAENDVVHSYFGMRTLSARPVADVSAPAALCLNGEPIYLRGALYQSYHPEGVYTAGDVQALIDDIAYAKRVGFDLLRVHIKIDDPLLLYYADTMGILLMADFPNFGEGGDTPLGRRRFETMMRAAIARDFNHPSIVAWCLFNETWGFGGQAEFVKLINPQPGEVVAPADLVGEKKKFANEGSWTWVGDMWEVAKGLDPTRLVEDMSVVPWDHLQYYGHGATDINSWHFYNDNYERAREHIEDVVGKTYAGSKFNYVPGFEQGAQPLINSEYGGVGALDGDRDVSWSFKFLTNELRRQGKLSAYIYTELHDVEWERNGFLNYDRTPKDFGYDPTIVNFGDVLPIDAPPITRCQPGQVISIDVYSSHYSRRACEDVTFYWKLSGTDSLGWTYDDLASGSKWIPFGFHQVELAERITCQLPEQTMLCTLWVRAVTAKGVVVGRNYVQYFAEAAFRAQEEIGQSLILRQEPHAWTAAQWDGWSTDAADAAGRRACAGSGHGHFEWRFPADGCREVKRIRVICEASAFREGNPQTDAFEFPTTLRMLLNGVRIYEATLPNHPHDSRGALSYLRGGRGAYGYLIHATVEGDLLAQVLARGSEAFSLRCLVPDDAPARGGLTVYAGDCGRFPVPPTIVVERV